MIVWIVAGVLGWGTFFALLWAVVLEISVEPVLAVLLAVLGFFVGAFSGFAEVSARQEIARLHRNVSAPRIKRLHDDLTRGNEGDAPDS